MVQQLQREQAGRIRPANEASGALMCSRIRVGILFAILTVLAIDAFATQLRIGTRMEGDTCEQMTVRPDEGLMSSGLEGSQQSMISFWHSVVIKLKLLIRLGVYVAAMTATWRTFATRDKVARTAEANLTTLRNELRATRLEMVAARSEADREKERMTAATRDMQEKHDVLHAKVGEETRKVDAAERGGVVTETVWRAAEAELKASRAEAVAWREKAVAARAETFAARGEAAADRETLKIALANSDMRAGGSSGDAFTAMEVMEQKLTLVRRKSAHEMKRAEAAEKATAVMNTAWRATEAALLASQEEAASARAQVLAEKKRAARALTTMSRKSSVAALALEEKNAIAAELAERQHRGMAAGMQELQETIDALERSVTDG